jgi:predicted Na+-dependent transporter
MVIIHPEERWLEEVEEEGDGGLKLFSAITTNILLFFLVFGLSATVEVKNLRHQLTNKAAIFTGVAMQFLVMPLLGFIAVCMLKDTGFTQPMGITLLVVTASPGGSFSNWWCSLFNADLALSVAMTSVSSILSVALLPANLIFYSWLAFVVVIPEEGKKVDILEALDLKTIFVSLGVVMGAIILGLYAGYVRSSPKFHKNANKFGSICGLLLILFSGFLGSGGGGGDANFWSMPWSFYIGTAFPCVLGMLLANIISRCLNLSRPETVAISIECCYQNTAIATSVAATMFSDPTTRTQAISVPLFYGLVEAFIIFVYCLWAWKLGWTKAPADEKLCVVITRTYEIEDDEEIEWDSEAAQKGWFARLFIPRAVEGVRSSDGMSTDDECKTIKRQRSRFDSSDVTVATQRSRTDSSEVSYLNATATPPGTPDGPQSMNEALHQSFDSMGDVEAQTAKQNLSTGKLEPLSEELSVSDQKKDAPKQEATGLQSPSGRSRRDSLTDSSHKSVNMAGEMSFSGLDDDSCLDEEKSRAV